MRRERDDCERHRAQQEQPNRHALHDQFAPAALFVARLPGVLEEALRGSAERAFLKGELARPPCPTQEADGRWLSSGVPRDPSR